MNNFDFLFIFRYFYWFCISIWIRQLYYWFSFLIRKLGSRSDLPVKRPYPLILSSSRALATPVSPPPSPEDSDELQPPWPSPFVLNDARCAALQPCPLRFVDLFFLWPRPTLSGAMVSVASRRRAPVVVLAPCGGLGGLLAPLWCGWRWSKRLGVSRAAVDVVAVVLTPSRSTSGTRFAPLSLSLDYPLCCVLLGTLAAIWYVLGFLDAVLR